MVATDTAGVVVDDAETGRVEITAYWNRLQADEVRGACGPSVLSDGGFGADAVVRFRPDLPHEGHYAVYLYWPSLSEAEAALATNAGVSVRHRRGSADLTVNMRVKPGQWHLLGTFPFDPSLDGYVEIRNDAADGTVLADAVLFRPVHEAEAPHLPQPDTTVVRHR